MIHCIWKMRLEILAGFCRYLMKRKFMSKCGDILFPNAKTTNLKVSVSPISDLWKRCGMSPGHEQIGKKARPSTHSVLKVWNAEAS